MGETNIRKKIPRKQLYILFKIWYCHVDRNEASVNILKSERISVGYRIICRKKAVHPLYFEMSFFSPAVMPWTCVYLWWIHVDIWQNQYNIVKLKNKIKIIRRKIKIYIYITGINWENKKNDENNNLKTLLYYHKKGRNILFNWLTSVL